MPNNRLIKIRLKSLNWVLIAENQARYFVEIIINHKKRSTMKNSFFVLVAFFILGSCSKSTTAEVAPTNQITMKIDGVAWSGNMLSAFIDNETLVFNAINPSTQETVGAVVGKVTGPGTYKVNQRTGNGLLFSKKTPTTLVYSGFDDAVVVVSSIKTVAGKQVPSGTFTATFVHKDAGRIKVTEGKF